VPATAKVKYIGTVVPWQAVVNLEGEQQIIMVRQLAQTFTIPAAHATWLTTNLPSHWEAA
jgi:hypothetical protein